MANNTRKAARVSLAKYGMDGVSCVTCYQMILYRVKHGLDPETGDKRR